MGANIPLPALDLRPQQPQENPVDQYMRLKAFQGQQQLQQQALQAGGLENQTRQLQIQKQQRLQQDQQTIQQAIAQNPGKTLADIMPSLSGKITLEAQQNAVEADQKIRKGYSDQTKDELENSQKQHAMYQERYNAIMQMPDQAVAQNWPQIAQSILAIPGNKLPIDPQKPMTKQQIQQMGPMLGLNDAYLQNEQAKRESAAKVSSAESEATIKQQQAQMAQSGGGAIGTGLDVQEANSWLRKNPGKDLADYAKYKATLVPAFNFNLQANGAGNTELNPRQQATAQAILDGRMSPPGSFALKTPYWQTVMGEVFKQDPQWNEQRAQLRKSYTVGKQSGEINAINTALGHVGNLADAVDALKNGDIPALNKIANGYGVQTGQTPVTTFNTIIHRVGPEITKAYVGAGGGEGERGTTQKDFDPSLGPDQLKSNIGITAKLLRSKISSLENQWNQNAPQGQDFQQKFIMPAARQALDRLAPEGGGVQAAKAAPTGATHIGVGTVDKKKHYLDASGKDLGVAE